MGYTAADAFFEALFEAGVAYCFVNLGSDHPAIMEAMVKGRQQKGDAFPQIITCPSEMVAMSMADGYARVTGKAQAVIVHVDVGTQALGCALHNAHVARTPVLIFAGLCPATIDGEEPGSRTEFVNWLQDIPDQSAIVRQYCRYTNEIRNSKNVKQMVTRALQLASSAPRGPAYLYAAREILEQELEPYELRQAFWKPLGPSALPHDAVVTVSEAMLAASEPLIITGYSGTNHAAPQELSRLADLVPKVRVLDTSISNMCFPATHPAWLSAKYSSHTNITTADFILVLDCDVPWVPTKCSPSKECIIYHIDVDPLKRSMPVYYIDALERWQADSCTAVSQIRSHITSMISAKVDSSQPNGDLSAGRKELHMKLLEQISIASQSLLGSTGPLNASIISRILREQCPQDTLYAVEAVTNTSLIYDQLQCSVPGSYLSSGATGLGWVGGASLGAKLAAMNSNSSKETFVTQIVGDGTYLFSSPSSVYWISCRYSIPFLVIILNNGGWNAPRVSMELVHPHGHGSKVSNKELNISFTDPTPDYVGIAKAASAGWVWGAKVETVGEFESVLSEAVQVVIAGRTAVVECKIRGNDPTKHE